MHETSKNQEHEHIIADSDRCVKCALCLPHCPTYALAVDENESPRGRIALMAAVAQGQLKYSTTLHTSLSHCLGCGACERACPAEVPYLDMLKRTRRCFPSRLSLRLRALLCLSENTFAQTLLKPLLRLYAAWRYKKLPLRATITSPKPLQTTQTVHLLKACFGEGLEADSLQAATQLLKACGKKVQHSPQGACCGGLHQQLGQSKRTQLSLQGTAISLRSGCKTAWQEQLSCEVLDLFEVLEQQQLQFAPLALRVLVHQACTDTQAAALANLLAQIPSLEIRWLTQQHCCGGAGLYPWQHPAQAQALRRRLVTQIPDDIDLIITNNLGCRLQLSQQKIPVCHPARLLAAALAS